MTDYSFDEIRLFGNLASASYNEGIPTGNPYELNGVNTGYILTNQTYDSVSSFGGQSYYSATDNRLVISFQGTSQLGDLVLTDLGVGMTGSFTNQSAFAQLFAAQALASVEGTGAEIVFVGHSLGGFLAQENVVFDQNYNAVVFNSPGLGGAQR